MTQHRPLVSIIVPVFNTESFLENCIISLLEQSYKEIEIILVDDGSIDQSGIICDYYAAKNSNIITIHNENQGVNFARQCGVKRATGDWVTFVDSDDTLPKDAIYNLISSVKIAHYSIIIGYANNVPIKKIKVITKDIFKRKSILGSNLTRNSLCGKLYHASLFKNSDILCTPKEIVQGEDKLANIKIAFSKTIKDIALIPFSVYNYRMNSSSCMHTFIPTIQYIELYNSVLISYIPYEERNNYAQEILLAKIGSLEFLSITSNNTLWKKQQFAKDIIRESIGKSIGFKHRLFLNFPKLSLRLYNLKILFRRLFSKHYQQFS